MFATSHRSPGVASAAMPCASGRPSRQRAEERAEERVDDRVEGAGLASISKSRSGAGPGPGSATPPTPATSLAVAVALAVTVAAPARVLGSILVAAALLASCASARPRPAPPPRAAVVHFLVGKVAYHKDEPARAVAELARAAELAPDDPEPTVALLVALAAQARAGAPDAEAPAPDLAALTAALARWPRQPTIWWAAGELATARGAPALAERYYRRAFELDPSLEPAAVALLELATAHGDHAAALSVARRLVAAAPASAPGHRALAAAAAQAGRHEQAVAELALALRAAPDDLATRSLLAEALARAGRLEDAIVQARSAFERSDLDLDLAPPLLALLCEAGDRSRALDVVGLFDDPSRSARELRVAVGWAIELGELALAERLAVAALGAAGVAAPSLAAAPSSTDTAASAAPLAAGGADRLAVLSADAGGDDRAEAATAAVLAAAEVAVARGDLSAAQGWLALPAAARWPRAHAWLTARAVAADPARVLGVASALPVEQRAPRLAALAAEAALALGQPAAAARAWLPISVGGRPASVEGLVARAELEHALGADATAGELLERAVTEHPRSALAAAALGRWLLAQPGAGRAGAARARALIVRARELAPGQPGPWIAWAELLRRARAPTEAVAALVRATACAPRDPEVALALARALAARGQPGPARRAVARGLAARPSLRRAAELRAALVALERAAPLAP